MMQWIEDTFAGVVTSMVEKLLLFFAAWIIQILTEMVNFIGTWWLKIGAPSMGEGSATDRVQTSTIAFVAVAGIIGTVFALIRLARDQDRASAENLVMGMVRTVLTSAIAVSVVSLSLTVADTVSPWLVSTISGSATEDGLGKAMGLDALIGTTMTVVSAGAMLFIAPIALLGAILNAALVIFSYGIAGALCGLLPIFAASSMTERGRKAFDKATGWLIAVILFKPAAAVIYGFGLALVKGITGESDNDVMNRLISLIAGLVVICTSSIALPALARILVPSVSAGPQGMGTSGLAMLGGAVAVGALTGGLGAGAGASAGGAAAAEGGAAAAAAEGGAAAAGGEAGAAGAAGAAGSAGTPGSSTPAEAGGTGADAAPASSGNESSSADGGPTPNTGGGPSSNGEAKSSPNTDAPQTSTGSETSTSTNDTANDATSPNSNSADQGTEPETGTNTGSTDSAGSGSAEPNGPGSHGGPSGSETPAPEDGAPGSTTGQGAESPTAEGARNGSADGTKSAINAQRLEFAMREAARDAENSLESGNEP